MYQERAAKKPICSKPVVEGIEAVPELDGKITLKILVALALALHLSVFYFSHRIGILVGYNSSIFPYNPLRISGLRIVSFIRKGVKCPAKRLMDRSSCSFRAAVTNGPLDFNLTSQVSWGLIKRPCKIWSGSRMTRLA